MRHPGDLQRMQIVGRADGFDGRDLGVRSDFLDRLAARHDRLAVDDDRAGAALSILAADLAAGEQELLAQHVGQASLRVDDERSVDAVDVESDSLHLDFFSDSYLSL
jgi:hypothetical protein